MEIRDIIKISVFITVGYFLIFGNPLSGTHEGPLYNLLKLQGNSTAENTTINTTNPDPIFITSHSEK